MKRKVLVLVLAALVAGGAFADSMLSAGGGFSFSGGRIGGLSYDDGFMGNNALGFGGHVFFDARFAEASIGIMGGPVNAVMIYDGDRETERVGSLLSMELSLLGKFPIDLGAVTFFPLLGIGANIVLSGSDEDGNDVDDVDEFSTFRIKLGVGADFGITESVFFRVTGLGWYGFAPEIYRDLADFMNAFGANVNAAGGFGGSLRLAVGFRF